MTLCPYGSESAAGAGDWTWVAWESLLGFLGILFEPLAFVGLAVPPVLHETAVFCATEPTQPTYPGDAVVAAASHDATAFDTCFKYLQDTATWYVWTQVCRCKPAPGSTACATVPANSFSWGGTVTAGATYNRGNGFKPRTTGLSVYGFRYWQIQSEPGTQTFALNTVSGTQLATYTTTSPPSGYHEFLLATPYPVTNGVEYVVDHCVPSSVPCYQLGSLTDDALVDYTQGYYNTGCGAAASTPNPGGFVGLLPLICGAAPPTTPTGPTEPVTTIPALPAAACSTTADLCAQISRVLVAEQLTQRRVDLLQRRTLPFAWIAGSALTGLTGAGAITVQDCLGAIVDLTTVPASWGSSTDTPRRLYPAAGLLQGQLGSEWDDGQWVRYEHQVVLWQDPWATGLRYNFKPGVVATITPLYPEP